MQTEAIIKCYQALRGQESFSLNAIKGIQGNRTVYTAQISFDTLAEQFSLVPSGLLPSYIKLQRELAKSRSNKIKRYVLENADYIFPEIIAVVEKINITEVTSGIVNLSVPADAFRYLVDGQGRLGAIQALINEKPDYKHHTIDIKFVLSSGIAADAQLFADINSTQAGTNSSQYVATDSRESINNFIKEFVHQSSLLRQRITFERASVTTSSTSIEVWSANQLRSFILLATGLSPAQAKKEFQSEERCNYWSGYFNVFFREAAARHADIEAVLSSSKDINLFRKASVIPTSVWLKSLGVLSKILMMHAIETQSSSIDWSILDGLSNIDFSVNNPEWIGRCLSMQGKFEDRSYNHLAVAAYLLRDAGIQLPDDVIKVEAQVQQSRKQLQLEISR
tara:strand:+ start:4866 stop:6047 length:1182 start_codon:yes stop_codon:yes gene_type:complete